MIRHLFDGEHSLIIRKIDENKVLFIQKEKFTEVLVPILSGLLRNTEISFKMMDEALKKRSRKKIQGIIRFILHSFFLTQELSFPIYWDKFFAYFRT